MESTDAPSTHARPPPLNREPSNTRPKGILKNVTSPVPGDDPGAGFPASTAPTAEGATTLRWDEVNLNLNEVNRDATMKITEPKTPYVRYDADTDTVMDLDKIPGFELGQPERHQLDASVEEEGDSTLDFTSAASQRGRPTPLQHPSATSSNAENDVVPRSASSRSSSFSGSRRESMGSRRSSDLSEKKMVVVEDLGPGVDAEDEGADEETRQAKKEFKERRGSHYSGEGEVMKRFRANAAAAALSDEDSSDDDEDIDESAVDMNDGEEGSARMTERQRAASNTEANRYINGHGEIPPVPPLPNGMS